MPSKKPFEAPIIEESSLVFEESLIKIQRDTLQLNRSPPYRYYSLLTPPYAVVILALTHQGAYVLNEEYRHPTKQFLLSCPGGFLNEEKEEPIEAAKRELEEETGFHAEAFTLLGSAYPYAGISRQKTIYVKATGAFLAVQPSLEPSEIIRTRLMTPQQLNQAIDEGAELDGTLCTALFFDSRHTQIRGNNSPPSIERFE